jgi:Flp pilus assembly pilin Flp
MSEFVTKQIDAHMTKCRDCESEIAAEAEICPNCGADQRSWSGRRAKKGLGIVEYVLILAFIAVLMIVALRFFQPTISNTLNIVEPGL